MTKDEFIDLVIKQLSGGLSDEEQLLLNRALEEHQEFVPLSKELEKQWNEAGKLTLDVKLDTHKSWTAFGSLKEKQNKVVSLWPTIYKVAAILFIGLALSFYFYPQADQPLVEYATTAGETKEIELPDGSLIWLNESTTVSVDADFGQTDRKLSLRGEAYFDIARDQNKPFIISAASTITEVLGTSFNIKTTGDKDEINVVSGRVSFTGGNNQLILTKGMGANFDAESQQLEEVVGNENSMAWRSKRLTFDNQPLNQVFTDLESYFNVKIQIETTNISNCLFTGTFDQPKLDEILKVIILTLNISYEQTEAGYQITGKGCSNQ